MSSKQIRKLQARTAAANGTSLAGGAAAPPAEGPESGGSDVDEPGASQAPRRPGFAALLDDSDASAGSDGGQNGVGGEGSAPKAAAPVAQASESKAAKGKKQKKKKKAAKGGSAPAADAALDVSDDDELLDRLAAATAAGAGASAGGSSEPVASVLSMAAADFSAEAERRRVMAGSRGAGAAAAAGKGAVPRGMAVRARGAREGVTAHHRRLLLIEPSREEPWPRPEACAEMVLCEDSDGAPVFNVVSPIAHEKIREDFALAQDSQDVEELQWFVREHPFCVEALVALADVARGSGEHEVAFDLTRRAVYAVECGFPPGFTPLRETGLGKTPRRPRVALQLPPKDEPNWAGWTWLTALITYMIGLQRQGLNRTSVEVCKLLLAMLLPRDPLHLLVHLDLLCIAAGQYRLLEQLNLQLLPQHVPCESGALSVLELVMPNFAYSLALARQLATGGPPDLAALKLVTVAAVAPVLEGSVGGGEAGDEEEKARLAPHAALMRALLLFPQVVRPLLDAASVRPDAPAPAASPCRKTWQDILALPPFTDNIRHKHHFLAHALISDAYVRHFARRWLSEALLLPWLHACAGRLAQMCESSLFHGELSTSRRAWSEAPLAFGPALAGDYASFSASEVGPEWQLPRVLIQASMEAAALHLPRPLLPMADESEADPGEETTRMLRALRDSLTAENVRQRRELVASQDAEYEQSLAMDRARSTSLGQRAASEGEAGGAAADEELVAQLVDMGFEASAARKALEAAGGSLQAALDRLAS